MGVNLWIVRVANAAASDTHAHTHAHSARRAIPLARLTPVEKLSQHATPTQTGLSRSSDSLNVSSA